MNQLIKLAIARFAIEHGRKNWKTELRKCWARSSYPGMGSDDSSYLQMARNSGVDLDKLTFDELHNELYPQLTLTTEDAGELFFAFRQRGHSTTRAKVADFLKAVDRLNGREPKDEWYAGDHEKD